MLHCTLLVPLYQPQQSSLHTVSNGCTPGHLTRSHHQWWATLQAVLECMQPAEHCLDMPGLVCVVMRQSKLVVPGKFQESQMDYSFPIPKDSTHHFTLEGYILNFFINGEFICHCSIDFCFDSGPVVTLCLITSSDTIQDAVTFTLI